MEHGVQFEINGKKIHSDELGINLVSYALSFPEPKTMYVELEGANGGLDLSEAFGKVYYKNRNLTLNFESKPRFNASIRRIATLFHGKKAKITIFDDADFYFTGRITFDKYSSDYEFGKVILNCECEPYKLKQQPTVKEDDVTSEKTVVYTNQFMESLPTFRSDSEIRFEFKGNSYSLAPNQSSVFPNVEFVEGNNTIKWVGNGHVTVTYQEGTL